MKTIHSNDLKKMRLSGEPVRVVKRSGPPKAAPEVAPLPPELPPPEPLELRLVDATTVERLVLEERETREALVKALAEVDRGARKWTFNITERDHNGFIKKIEATPTEG